MYDINLYPPIFNQSYMPAFVIGNACRVYFQLSDLNTLNDLYHITSGGTTYYGGIQVTVRDQKTNQSALINSYGNEILLKQLTQIDENNFFIEISNAEIAGGFLLNKYYKVQIRFTSNSVTGSIPDPTSSDFGAWLQNNLDNFSQWSTVALVRGISNPTLTFSINNNTGTGAVTVSTDYIKINGTLTFNSNDTERLDTYRITIKNNTTNIIEEDSGDLYSQGNQIQYTITKALKVNQSYNVKIAYTTNNLYESSGNRNLTINSITPMSSNMLLKQEVNNSGGFIKLILARDTTYTQDLQTYNLYQFDNYSDMELILVSDSSVSTPMTKVKSNDKVQYDHAIFDPYWQRAVYYDEYNQSFLERNSNIIIRRASSRTNFDRWEKLAEFTIEEDHIVNLYWYDYSAEPGVWYRYQVIREKNQQRTAELQTPADKPVMLDTEDIFLNSKGRELIVRFDPSISNMSNKVAESVTETIGSQYPFIRRNGNVNYKTFSLSGTISCFMDIENNVLRASKQEVFGDSAHLYKDYNESQNIDLYNDYIYEKFFRQKVAEFLQNTDVKLFRSLTEGNILVRLNGVVFTPNQTLGRLIYSFSCTAYEVAECNEVNYDKYKILTDNIKILTRDDIRENKLGG